MLLITGAEGQLGRELSTLLPEALTTDVSSLDITDSDAVAAFVKEHKIDTIINCPAYTAVDNAEKEPEPAERINVIGPRNLARSGAKIIHISTDYVFDGCACRPYLETDTPHPVSVYGKTKLAGEEAVLHEAESAIILRTAWLYSPYGRNFVKTIRRLGAEQQKLQVVYDQIGTPTYAADLAQAIVDILPQFEQGHRGVYHYSNLGVCSWYDFAVEILNFSGLKCPVEPVESSEYASAAKRPGYSVLNKSKIISQFKINIPYWKESLKKCLTRY